MERWLPFRPSIRQTGSGTPEGEDSELPELAGIADPVRNGVFQEFRMEYPERSQELLHQLADQRTVMHFEVIKPSLHDIFVRIAR